MSDAERPRVLVTGGTGVVGRAVVRELVRRGARVAFTFHSAEERAHALCKELGSGAVTRHVDLLQVDQIDSTLTRLADDLGGVDAFVHAAGLASVKNPPVYDSLSSVDSEGWDRLFGVNVKAAAFAVRALESRLEASKGNVVLLGALSGVKMVTAPAAYAASKAAVVGLTEALAKELGAKGIRINVVAPGILSEGASMTVPRDLRDEYLKHSALKRFGEVDEVAAVVGFFALDNTYVTGRAIAVDGGL